MVQLRSVFILLGIMVALSKPAVGDGIPFIHGGQRIDGATSVLTLTKAQIAELRWGHALNLTQVQRTQLVGDAGYSPNKITVLSKREAKTTCTCEETNIGVRFATGKVEVPHALLGPDMESRPILQGKDWWLRDRHRQASGVNSSAEQGHPLDAQGDARK